MRMATPLLTCSVIRAAGSSATSEAISTPRTMGPGWRIDGVGLEHGRPAGGEAEAGGVLAERGDELPAAPFGLHPQQGHHVGLGQDVVQIVPTAATGHPSSDGGSRVAGATRVTSAPRAA